MITPLQLKEVADYTTSMTPSERLVGHLRQQFSEIHFTYCQNDDVFGGSPVYQDKAFNLYLIDSRNHCLSFTQDMTIATGIVVAEIDE